MTFGKHLALDCTGFNANMRSKRVIQDFRNDLVIYVLKMKKKGETVFEYFPDNDYNRIRDIVGFSVVQVISLSIITLHLNDISKTAYIDVFTCGNIDVDKVIECIAKYFDPSTVHSVLMSRDANEGSKVIVRDGGIVKGLYEKGINK